MNPVLRFMEYSDKAQLLAKDGHCTFSFFFCWSRPPVASEVVMLSFLDAVVAATLLDSLWELTSEAVTFWTSGAVVFALLEEK